MGICPRNRPALMSSLSNGPLTCTPNNNYHCPPLYGCVFSRHYASYFCCKEEGMPSTILYLPSSIYIVPSSILYPQVYSTFKYIVLAFKFTVYLAFAVLFLFFIQIILHFCYSKSDNFYFISIYFGNFFLKLNQA